MAVAGALSTISCSRWFFVRSGGKRNQPPIEVDFAPAQRTNLFAARGGQDHSRTIRCRRHPAGQPDRTQLVWLYQAFAGISLRRSMPITGLASNSPPRLPTRTNSRVSFARDWRSRRTIPLRWLTARRQRRVGYVEPSAVCADGRGLSSRSDFRRTRAAAALPSDGQERPKNASKVSPARALATSFAPAGSCPSLVSACSMPARRRTSASDNAEAAPNDRSAAVCYRPDTGKPSCACR